MLEHDFGAAAVLGVHFVEGQATYYRQVAQYDHAYTERLDGLYPKRKRPLLILWGEKRRWVDITVGERVARVVSKATLRGLEGRLHTLEMD